jgi:hypothetical protein
VGRDRANLNAIGRWTSPIERTHKLSFAICFHTSELWDEAWITSLVNPEAVWVGYGRVEVICARVFKTAACQKKGLGARQPKQLRKRLSLAFEPFRLDAMREAVVVIK